ncbi:TonB family protein [Hymenobacter wooponensis]|uniref:TonB family protein n=1 Tax=Hymenobacter wooponensis TaxID=1525360 RepID=A0A4Z0MF20_9BACT|nr:TonB family protein [Hymenobacter wooponensis]TGD77898.1 TonB family protein [Hymenobacter wooponensis]
MRPLNPASELLPSASRHLPVEVLREYVAGTLPPAEQQQVEAHTLDCPQCSEVLTGLEMQPATVTDASLDELRQRLHARVEELATEARPRPALGWAWQQLAAAAALVLTLGASVLWFAVMHRSSTEVASSGRQAIERLAIRAPRPVPVPQTAVDAAEPLAEPIPPDVVASMAASPQRAPKAVRRRMQKPQDARVAPKVHNGPDVQSGTEVIGTLAAGAQATVPRADTVLVNAATVNSTDQKQDYAVQPAPAAPANKPGTATATLQASGLPAAKRKTKAAVSDSGAMRTVYGRITDQTTGQGLQGATVLVPGTRQGASTAADGSFSLTVPANTSQLSISSIGYAAKTQPLKPNDSTLALALAPDTKQLSEVVVVRREAAPAPMAVSAMPAGGYGSLKKYLKDSLDYPEKALEAHTEGTVRLRFVVGEDGKVSDIKVVKKLTDECDAEAIRLIQEGPAWFPAIVNGRRTPRQVEVSVPFKIEGR